MQSFVWEAVAQLYAFRYPLLVNPLECHFISAMNTEPKISIITKPFNPSQIEVEEKNATINTLLDMLRGNMIDLQPNFQRHANLWDDGKKSRLIESILLGLPLPSFYFEFDKRAKQWIVIDGLQRLCALNDFMSGKLRLKDLEFLAETWTGSTYDSMPPYDKMEFGMRTVNMNILKGDTPPNVKFIIFKRLNTGGLELKDAEIRNALFQGKATDIVQELLIVLHDFLGKSVNEKRMADHDYVTRFLAHKLINYSGYKKLSNFLADAMATLNEASDVQLDKLKKSFSDTLQNSINLMGDSAFRKPSEIKRNRISLALFECTMVCLSEISDAEHRMLLQRRTQFMSNYTEMFNDEKFKKALSDGVGQKKSVNYRIELTRSIIRKTLQ